MSNTFRKPIRLLKAFATITTTNILTPIFTNGKKKEAQKCKSETLNLIICTIMKPMYQTSDKLQVSLLPWASSHDADWWVLPDITQSANLVVEKN